MASKNSSTERRRLFAAELRRKRLDWALISNPKHIFYFTGFQSNLNPWLTVMKGPRSTSFLTVDAEEGEARLLLGATELASPWTGEKVTDAVKKRTFAGEVTTYADYDLRRRMVPYGDFVSKELERWLKGKANSSRNKRIGVEDWHLAHAYTEALSRAFRESRFEGISETIMLMRRTKGTDEISHIRAATAMIESGYRVAKEAVTVGETEVDVFREMNHESFRKFGPFGEIIGDHVSGERSVAVGGWPTARKLQLGETIILDLQAASNNYWSDLCRTFVAGKPTAEQEKVLEVLVAAKEAGERILRPGTKGAEIYKSVSDVMVRNGYPRLPHHAGHSVGLDDQEPLWLIPNNQEVVEEGAVCVLEPGIYVLSVGGIRIEDAYVITKSGNRKISSFPLGLS